MMNLKSIIGAAAVALTGAMLTVAPAQAVQIKGQIDITGIVDVQNSDFEPGGALVFDHSGTANVLIAEGDFSGLAGSTPTLFDLTFTAPEEVWSVGGFTFTALNYSDFDNTFPGRGFSARGTLSGAGFDDTPGIMVLSTQSSSGTQIQASFSSSTSPVPVPASVLMLLSAMAGLGGLGFLTRRHAGVAA